MNVIDEVNDGNTVVDADISIGSGHLSDASYSVGLTAPANVSAAVLLLDYRKSYPPAEAVDASLRSSHGVVHLAVTSSVLGVIILATIFGNVFVVAAIVIERNLRQVVANYLIASLAVADLMVAALVMPLAAVNEVSASWFLGSELCDAWTSFDMLCCTASILHLVAISLDRYWAVTQIDYIRNRSSRRILIMIAASWTVSAVVSVPPLFGDRDSRRSPETTGVCEISQDRSSAVFSTVAAFYLPLVAMMIIYARIYRAARSRIRKQNFGKRRDDEKQRTLKLTLMTGGGSGGGSRAARYCFRFRNVLDDSGCWRRRSVTARGGKADADGDDDDLASIPLTEYASTTAFSTPPVTPARRWCRSKSELTAVRIIMRSLNGSPCRTGNNGSAIFEHRPEPARPEHQETDVASSSAGGTVQAGDDSDKDNDLSCLTQPETELPKANVSTTFAANATNTPRVVIVVAGEKDSSAAIGETAAQNGASSSSLSLSSMHPGAQPVEESSRPLYRHSIAGTATYEHLLVSGGTEDAGLHRHLTATLSASGCSSTSADERSPSRSPSRRMAAKRAAAAAVEAAEQSAMAAAAAALDSSARHCQQNRHVRNGSVSAGAAAGTVSGQRLHWTPSIDGPSGTSSSQSWKARDGQAAAREKLKQKRERKAARTLAIVTGTFVVCWLPYFIVALIQPFFDSDGEIGSENVTSSATSGGGELPGYPPELRSVIGWLGYANSLLNPAIYTVFNPDFRSAFRRILFGRCRSRGGSRDDQRRKNKHQQLQQPGRYQRAVVCE